MLIFRYEPPPFITSVRPLRIFTHPSASPPLSFRLPSPLPRDLTLHLPNPALLPRSPPLFGYRIVFESRFPLGYAGGDGGAFVSSEYPRQLNRTTDEPGHRGHSDSISGGLQFIYISSSALAGPMSTRSISDHRASFREAMHTSHISSAVGYHRNFECFVFLRHRNESKMATEVVVVHFSETNDVCTEALSSSAELGRLL